MASPEKFAFSGSTLPQFYEFGPFRIDIREHLLFRDQRLVSLPLKVFETLLFLVQQNGHIVDKSDLIKRLWPDTHVGPRSLAQNIFLLRNVLGAPHSQFIETVPRRGYRFAAQVQLTQDGKGSNGLQVEHPTHVGVLSIRQLAVLPFRFLGEERTPEAEYLGIGLADALITKFSNLEELIVRPTSSVLKYAKGGQGLLEIGRELGVDSILEGKFQSSGSRIRVSLQLLDAYNGAVLLADRFDCDLADVFALQDAISERVIQSLALKLSSAERVRLTACHTNERPFSLE
jgi:TolB-like protein